MHPIPHSTTRFIRRRVCPGAALIATLVLGLAGAQTRGQGTVPLSPRPRAELREAERLHREAIVTTDHVHRTRCLEEALAIYARLGRASRFVQVGLRYRDFLEQCAVRSPAPGELRQRLRELDLQLGESYLALGHYTAADTHLERALTDYRELAPLSLTRTFAALAGLAYGAEQRGNLDRAARFWQQVEDLARGQLGRPPADLPFALRRECVWRLADSHRFRRQPERAIACLAPLLKDDQLGEGEERRETLRRLAGHHAARGEHAAAAEHLRQATDLNARMASVDPLVEAELAEELAEVLAAQGREDDARKLRDAAVRHYTSVLNSSDTEGPETRRLFVAFWKLQSLYHKSAQVEEALRLAQDQEERWHGVLAGPRLRIQQGNLQAYRGAFDLARRLLGEAAAELEREEPRHHPDLLRAWGHLAVAEHGHGNLDRADEIARKALALHRELNWPDDLMIADLHNLLGACAAERVQYAEAVEWFRRGETLCAKLGPPARLLHSRLLLNLALVHKSQGDPGSALATCQKAREVYQLLGEGDWLGVAALDAAEASLHCSLLRLEEAYRLSRRIQSVCEARKVDHGPLVITARHCQGLYHLSRREFDAAEKAWGELRMLQEKASALALPRTLNYLGLTAELRGNLGDAENLYQQARQLQQAGRRALPVTQFITLWRLAGLIDRRGDRAVARRLLEEAVGVVEEARLRTYGDAQQRAAFFGQFEPGFDLLVEWCVRDGDVEGAFRAVTRSRSRALLDQLQLAGADPRAALRKAGGEHQALLRREEELRQQISRLQARAQLISPEEAETAETRKLLADLDRAQEQFTEAWREIYNANPVFRNLADRDPSPAVSQTLRRRVLDQKTMVLVYHVGRERSHLLLLGGGLAQPEAYPLIVPPGLIEHLAVEVLVGPPVPKAAARDLKAVGRAAPAEAVRPVDRVPLNQVLARTLVDTYRDLIADPNDLVRRGLDLRARPAGDPVPVQDPTLLADVLLPPRARRRIRERAPDCLVVLPDGPLHRLPLEALQLQRLPKPRYLLDELPPIVYAPSAAVLAVLAERDRPDASGPWSLLTVSNPDFPLRPRLPATAQESLAIRRFFAPNRFVALEGIGATERAVRDCLLAWQREKAGAGAAPRRVLHLAAHGFADDRFGNLFGALALTPGRAKEATADDDGLLTLHEIYGLPLEHCELAVLSACQTNVGPQRSLEAGITLASAFLAAGARRVMASHWSVDDESTGALMEAYFDELTAATRRGDRLAYAEALRKARLKVRNTAKWETPYHWAPFVLIGPAE